MQETWVQLLIREDLTYHGATEPMLHNKRNHHNEKATHRGLRVALTCHN